MSPRAYLCPYHYIDAHFIIQELDVRRAEENPVTDHQLQPLEASAFSMPVFRLDDTVDAENERGMKPTDDQLSLQVPSGSTVAEGGAG